MRTLARVIASLSLRSWSPNASYVCSEPNPLTTPLRRACAELLPYTSLDPADASALPSISAAAKNHAAASARPPEPPTRPLSLEAACPARPRRSVVPPGARAGASPTRVPDRGVLTTGTSSSAEVLRRKRRDPGLNKAGAGETTGATSSAELFRRKRRMLGDANMVLGPAARSSSRPHVILGISGDSGSFRPGNGDGVADVFRFNLRAGGDIAKLCADPCVSVAAAMLSSTGSTPWPGETTSQEVLRRKRRGVPKLTELAAA